MDYGYHTMVVAALTLHHEAEECMSQSKKEDRDNLVQQIKFIKTTTDSDNFQQLYAKTFMPPDVFEFQPHKGDEVLSACYKYSMYWLQLL